MGTGMNETLTTPKPRLLTDHEHVLRLITVPVFVLCEFLCAAPPACDKLHSVTIVLYRRFCSVV